VSWDAHYGRLEPPLLVRSSGFFLFLSENLIIIEFDWEVNQTPTEPQHIASDCPAKQTSPENHYHSTGILLDNVGLSSFLSLFFPVTRIMGQCCCYGWFVGVRLIPLTNNLQVLTVCRGSRAPYWERQSLLPAHFFPSSPWALTVYAQKSNLDREYSAYFRGRKGVTRPSSRFSRGQEITVWPSMTCILRPTSPNFKSVLTTSSPLLCSQQEGCSAAIASTLAHKHRLIRTAKEKLVRRISCVLVRHLYTALSPPSIPHLRMEPSSKEHHGQSACGYRSRPGIYWQPPVHLEVSRGWSGREESLNSILDGANIQQVCLFTNPHSLPIWN